VEDITTILVVDDSLLSRKMVTAFALEAFPDANVIAAETGEQALEKTAGVSFQLATIDFNMPGMDGLTLVEKLKRDHPDARFALVTANIQDSIAKRAKALGVEFVSKPVTEENITRFMRGKGSPP